MSRRHNLMVEQLATHILRECGAGRGLPSWTPEEILEAADVDPTQYTELWQEALAMMAKGHVYQYAKADHTVDAVVFHMRPQEAGGPQFLAVRRGRTGDPHEDEWALPGGFMDPGERLVTSVRRELKEETGLDVPENRFDQIKTHDEPDRDPRGRVLSTSFGVVVTDREAATTTGAEEKAESPECRWWPLSSSPKLAFDHSLILHNAWAVLMLKGVLE